MNSTVTITMDSERKKQAEQLFRELGMDMNTAMNVFVAKCLEWNGIPFSIEHRYNAETEAAFQEARDIAAGKIQTKSYATVQEMMDDILSEDDDANRMRIHDAIVEGMEQVRNGQVSDGNAFLEELKEKYN